MTPNVCRKTQKDHILEVIPKNGLRDLCGIKFVGKGCTKRFGQVWGNPGKNLSHPQK